MRWCAVVLATALCCAAPMAFAETASTPTPAPTQGTEAQGAAATPKVTPKKPAPDKNWTRLRDDVLNNALSGHALRFEDGHRQGFGEDGSTRRSRGSPAMGFWKTDDEDRLCLSWPPSEDWICYVVERDAAGERLRLTAADGSRLVGEYHD